MSDESFETSDRFVQVIEDAKPTDISVVIANNGKDLEISAFFGTNRVGHFVTTIGMGKKLAKAFESAANWKEPKR